MLKAKLTIAGSNFIFKHINENYSEYLSNKKKLRVIFRGINIDYYNKKNISILKQEKLKQDWKVSPSKFVILMPGRLTYWKGQVKFIESLNTQQFQKVQQFFDTMPKLKHAVELDNPKTGVKSKVVLQGLNDFFA